MVCLGTIPFYQYLKIVKAYQSFLQNINQHLVLIIPPTRHVDTLRYHREYFEYWKSFEPYLHQFVQKIIPDVHICPHDYLSFQTRYLSPTTTSKVIQAFHASCLHFSSKAFHCNLLQQFASQNQGLQAAFPLITPFPFIPTNPCPRDLTLDLCNTLLNQTLPSCSKN